MKKISKRVVVAMSGGVDSSVAAFLLKKQGYDVVGVFMKCYNLDGCAERDAEDARRVAQKLGIPFYVWDFEQEYKERVVDYMVDGYRRGITPNPDVMCNKEIKFGLFLEKALTVGADFVATGHYVRLSPEFPISNSQFPKKSNAINLKHLKIENSLKIENCKLKIAKDGNKDQSYFLWTLTQEQLQRCLFPIGDYLKPEVREIARKVGLPTAEKKDSQGICFLGKISIDDFLKKYIPERRGELVTTSGERIGEHSGAEFYTIGQRHIDADIAFPKTGGAVERRPYYVSGKDINTNTVTLAEGDDNPALYRKEVELGNMNFINSDSRFKIQESRILARVRYRQSLSKATLRGNALTFEQPQKFVAAGQSAVFYSEDGRMLGGGVIV